MINDKRIVVLVFYGRRQYVSMLLRYLARDLRINGGVIDEIAFLRNTAEKESVDLLERFMEKFAGCCTIVPSLKLGRGAFGDGFHYVNQMAGNTIAVKIDDDIVWIERNAIRNLIREQLIYGGVVSGNIINMTLLNHVHQRLGAFSDESSFIEYEAFGARAWGDGHWAARYHRNFLDKHKQGRLVDFTFRTWVFADRDRWSINAICWSPDVFHGVDMSRIEDDEAYISRDHARVTGSCWRVAGNALFSHWAYFSQREILEAEYPGLLKKYDDISLQEGLVWDG